MKSLKRWAGLLALPLVAGLVVSCDDDDNNGGGADLRPTLVLDGQGDFIDGDVVVNPGETLNFKVVAQENSESTKNLERFEIESIFNNQDSVRVDSSFNERTFNAEYSFTAREEAGPENFTFRVTDRDGLIAEREIVITVQGLEVRQGDINHIAGRCQGAFDLINVTGLSSSASNDNKDLINTDDAGENSFTGSFEATNGTMFRIAGTAFDYDSATEEDIEDAYTAPTIIITNPGSPSASVSNPEAGDVYLVKLRNTSPARYAAMRIAEVVVGEDDNCPANDGVANNKGEMTFEYKIPTDVVAN